MTTPAIARPSLLDLVHQDGAQRVPRILTVPTPAAGADWSITVPAGVVWEIQTIKARLVTAVAVANRGAVLVVNDSILDVFSAATGLVQAASLTTDHVFAREYGAAVTGSGSAVAIASWPNVPLLSAWKITSLTTAIQAADQWSAIVLYVVELRPPLAGSQRGLDPNV